VQVIAVVDGGACSGQLQIGDTITQVNSVNIVGKGPKNAQTVFEASCRSLGKVVLHLDRPGKCMVATQIRTCTFDHRLLFFCLEIQMSLNLCDTSFPFFCWKQQTPGPTQNVH
jgi:hypothetical protein